MQQFKTAQDRDAAAVRKALDGWWTESMRNHEERIRWWREARFGMFVHWGVSSLLGGVWQGKPVDGYSEHIMRSAEITLKDYREQVIEKFSAENFNADSLIKCARDAGMRYFIITAKHQPI